jgi:hypothetical protein
VARRVRESSSAEGLVEAVGDAADFVLRTVVAADHSLAQKVVLVEDNLRVVVAGDRRKAADVDAADMRTGVVGWDTVAGTVARTWRIRVKLRSRGGP